MACGAVGRLEVLRLYRQLLREGRRFADYNFREYAERRVRDAFKEKRLLTDPQLISRQYSFGQDQLRLLRRQTQLSQMFSQPRLVVERTRAQ